jgi:hypothetical protein
MTTGRLVFAVLAAFLVTGPALAGPCTAEIDRAQARLDQKIDAVAGAGTTGTQSTAAQTHRQPTPGSVARAEEKLGEGTSLEPAMAALTQARKADAADDRAGCEKALNEVARIVGP